LSPLAVCTIRMATLLGVPELCTPSWLIVPDHHAPPRKLRHRARARQTRARPAVGAPAVGARGRCQSFHEPRAVGAPR
jgi:hypothetical protein